jgi:serine/threonine protein kinase/predicted Zn-dependent protease
MVKKCPKCQSDNPDSATFCADCGAQLPSLEDIEVTETIETPKEELTRGTIFAGRYEIIEELGKGGMGRVYRVEDKKLEQEVALKLIKPEIAKDKKTIERFRNELKTARMISHKNVCRMFDMGESKDSRFITMEFIRGEDLKSLIQKMGQLSAGQAIAIAKQVCDGLNEAHKMDVIHRDLKPQNIMIDRHGDARIMDFGIARSLEAKGITGAGVMIGTPEYMSPEQVEGKETDQRSDIYSLGVILYEMVTGRVPFEGDTALSIAVMHKTETPKAPIELNSQMPEALNSLIMRCLEKDKQNRYQSAGELRSELEGIDKGIPTTERVVPERKPLTSREITVTFGLKKLLVPVFLVIALAVIALIVWQVIPKRETIPTPPPGKPSLAVMYFENNSRDKSLDNWRDALAEMMITDLSQSKFLHVTSTDQTYTVLRRLDLLDKDKYSTDDLQRVAREARIKYILNGSFITTGKKFIINVAILNTDSGNVIDTWREEGPGEDSITQSVDRITKRVKTALDLSSEQIANDIDRAVGNITTSSPEALKHFIEGSRYYRLGESRKAIDSFERAIAIDPEFAMAYRNMAASFQNLGYTTRWRDYRKKAFELTGRVTDRERYRIEGDYYRRAPETLDKAIEAFQKLLEIYPDDWIGNNSMGLIYLNAEEWDKAQKYYEVNVDNRVEAWQSYWNLALVYGNQGLYDQAKKVYEIYINEMGDNARIRRGLAWNYVDQGEYALALAELDKAGALSPENFQIIMDRGEILLIKGDVDKAEEEYQKLMIDSEPMARVYHLVHICGLYVYQGRYREAIRQLELGMEMAKKIGETVRSRSIRDYLSYVYWRTGDFAKAVELEEEIIEEATGEENFSRRRTAMFHKGLMLADMNQLDEATKVAEEIKSFITKEMNKNLIRDYYHILGRIEVKRNNYALAIEHLQKTLDLYPYVQGGMWRLMFTEPLAEAYYESGDLDKALRAYEDLSAMVWSNYYTGDIYVKSFYMLGKIWEQKGDTTKATGNYEKFLDLWKDADPGIAEVEDAKKRLAGLR